MLYEVKSNKRYLVESSEDLSINQQVCFAIDKNNIQIGRVTQSHLIGSPMGTVLYAVNLEQIVDTFKKIQYLSIIKCQDLETNTIFQTYINVNILIEKNDRVICSDISGRLSYCKVVSSDTKLKDTTTKHVVVYLVNKSTETKGKDWCTPKGISVGDTVIYTNRHRRSIMSISEVHHILSDIQKGIVLYIEDAEHKLKYFRCTGNRQYVITRLDVGDILLVYNLPKQEFRKYTIKQSKDGSKYFVDIKDLHDSLDSLINNVIKYNYVIKHIDRNNEVIYEGLPGLSMEVV